MNIESTSYWDRPDAKFRPKRPSALEPEALFFGEGSSDAPPSVADFWRWGYSDLKDNVIRGALGEFLVATALGLSIETRNSWEPFDLLTPDGVKIEVKTSALLQSWAQNQRSKIVFSGLKAKSWDAATGKFSGATSYHADVYVFCVQSAQEHDDYDRLNLSQWHFYVASRAVLEPINVNSISESKLLKLRMQPVRYGQLGQAVQSLRHA